MKLINHASLPRHIAANRSNLKSEEAQQDIVLPAVGKELKIENGGDFIVTAGNSITLKPGFHAKAGSKFMAQINPDFTEEMDINVPRYKILSKL